MLELLRSVGDQRATETAHRRLMSVTLLGKVIEHVLGRVAVATMKRLTGGDRIRTRRMHQNFFEFTGR